MTIVSPKTLPSGGVSEFTPQAIKSGIGIIMPDPFLKSVVVYELNPTWFQLDKTLFIERAN
jgi:hypothetical protein